MLSFLFIFTNTLLLGKGCKKHLIVGTNSTLSIWDPISGKKTRTMNNATNYRHHLDSIEKFSFSLDGSKAATLYKDNTIKLWDINNYCDNSDVKLDKTLSGPISNEIPPSLALTPYGKMVLSTSSDPYTALLVWDVQSGIMKNLSFHKENNNRVYNLAVGYLLTH